MNFEEQILEAAKSIAAATSALVKAASAAQRELVAQGKVSIWISRSMGTAAALLSTQLYSGRLLHIYGEHRSDQALLLPQQVGAIPANALDDGQWSQGLISAVSVQHPLGPSEVERLEKAGEGMDQGNRPVLILSPHFRPGWWLQPPTIYVRQPMQLYKAMLARRSSSHQPSR